MNKKDRSSQWVGGPHSDPPMLSGFTVLALVLPVEVWAAAPAGCLSLRPADTQRLGRATRWETSQGGLPSLCSVRTPD